MTRDDHETTDPELAELALELRERERGQEDDDSLFPESFMHEFTDFKTWDEFKVRLAATPRPELESFVSSTTRFTSFEEMERTALERLGSAKLGEVKLNS